jgi:putative membrane protein
LRAARGNIDSFDARLLPSTAGGIGPPRGVHMAYLWTKSIHLLFVMAWVATVFYLPRLLVNLAEASAAGEPEATRTRLLLMGRRLYRFGHSMFGMAVLFGVLLWFGHRAWPATFPDVVAGRHWIDAKLTLVLVLLAYFILCGRRLKAIAAGAAPGSAGLWRLLNELPVLLLLGVIYLVLAKPF